MAKGDTRDLNTLRVRSVSSAATPDGRIALVFQLEDQTIGFEMNEQTIAQMREHLAALESFLFQKPGKA